MEARHYVKITVILSLIHIWYSIGKSGFEK